MLNCCEAPANVLWTTKLSSCQRDSEQILYVSYLSLIVFMFSLLMSSSLFLKSLNVILCPCTLSCLV